MVDPTFVALVSTGANVASRGKQARDIYKMPPLGLMSIAAVLQMHGYDASIFDLTTQDVNPSDFIQQLRGLSRIPAIVGLSVWTETSLFSIQLAKVIKEAFPETTIVMGGPHVTFVWDEALAHPEVDFVVRGEGEFAMIEILENVLHGLPRERIPGIAYRADNGKICCTPERQRIMELDLLPIPAYTSLAGSYRPKVLYMVTSRGCPGKCMFCASRAFSGGVPRMHSAEWIVSTIFFHQQQFPFDLFCPMDDTFNASMSRLRRVHQLLQQCGVRVAWAIKSRVDLINDENARLLKEAGCVSVHLGVESGDDDVLKAIGKNTTQRQIHKAVLALARYGIRVEASFIVGHYCDTLETIDKTLLLAAAVREIGVVAFGVSTPFPGTPLSTKLKELGIELVIDKWRQYNLYTPIYENGHFTVNDLRRAIYLSERIDLLSSSDRLLSGNNLEIFRRELTDWVNNVRQCMVTATRVSSN